jgi:hypothetical protein
MRRPRCHGGKRQRVRPRNWLKGSHTAVLVMQALLRNCVWACLGGAYVRERNGIGRYRVANAGYGRQCARSQLLWRVQGRRAGVFA